jgi:hypothetical protein
VHDNDTDRRCDDRSDSQPSAGDPGAAGAGTADHAGGGRASRTATARAARPPLEAVVVRVGVRSAASPPTDIVDLWGEQSFPASDPPANW